MIVHGDIQPCNFLIDPKTLRVTIIDFGGMSALPHSFVSFTLYAIRDKFVVGINKFLDWKRSDNFLAMAAATGVYYQVSSNHLGEPHLYLASELRANDSYRPGQGWFPTASTSTRKGGSALMSTSHHLNLGLYVTEIERAFLVEKY